MSKYEMVSFVILMLTGGGVLMTVVTSWFRYKEKQLDAARRVAPGSDDRLARIEAAVEAMAIEVERISEGQRFTSKLLAERQQPSAAPLGAGHRNDAA